VHTEPGSALLHLGMSGSLRVLAGVDAGRARTITSTGAWIRARSCASPIRAASARQLWQPRGQTHPNCSPDLGPEPLSDGLRRRPAVDALARPQGAGQACC
jgi:formamidopyrimidine-DNA glycosylase